MKKKRKLKNKSLLIILVLLISVGYALLSTKISINGVGKIKNARWDIHLENIQLTEGSVEPISEATIDDSKTAVNYSVELDVPGDYYEFSVDVVNDGTIDGMVEDVLSKIKINDEDFIDLTSESIPSYLTYKVKYENGSEIQPKHELKANQRETYKVRVEFKKDIDVSDLPLVEQNLQFAFSVDYVQKDNTSYQVPKMEVGKYIFLTPDSSSYVVSKDDTGYDEDQTITPNELSLWRIISKNSDGTFDAISEYVSNDNIYLNGDVGYANAIGVFQDIANQYQKSGFTTGARIFGYNGQTQRITDTSKFDGSNSSDIYTQGTDTLFEGVGEEFNNGIYGDTLYLRDYQLVNNVYQNNIKAYKVSDKNNVSAYWIGSRKYSYTSDNNYYFGVRSIDTSGEINNIRTIRSYISNWTNTKKSCGIRPIITIKDNLVINDGSGDLSNPYILSNE